jgi:hypothetical protein
MPKHNAVILILLLSVFFSTVAVGQPELGAQREYPVIIDLKSELLVYNDDYETYMPYVQGTPFTESVALSWLRLARYRNYNLRVGSPQGLALFINQNITARIPESTIRTLSIDSLHRIYGDSCLISVYAEELNLDKLALEVIGKQPVAMASGVGTDSFLQVTARSPGYFYNFFLLAALGVLAVLAVLRNMFPRVFASYYSLSDAISARTPINDAFSYKLGGTGQLGFIASYSLLFGFLLITLFHAAGLEYRLAWLIGGNDAGEYLWAWIRISALLFVLQLVKYGLLQLAAGLFGIDVAANHFFDYLRFSQIVITFILSVVLILFLAVPSQAVSGADILLQLALFFALLRTGYLFYKLVAAGERRKTYLFSYLCTTEILPLLVGLRLLAG